MEKEGKVVKGMEKEKGMEKDWIKYGIGIGTKDGNNQIQYSIKPLQIAPRMMIET